MRALLLLVMLVLSATIRGDAEITCSNEVITVDNCTDAFGSLCQEYSSLAEQYSACGCDVDPCAEDTGGDYDKGYHVAAIFIILGASLFGALLPIISKNSRFKIPPYFIALGKCVGIGVVLACALVHMLAPSNESLTSPCVPAAFNTDYTAYAFLYAILAGLGMQFLDYCVMQYLQSKKTLVNETTKLRSLDGHAHDEVHAYLVGVTHKTISAYLLEFGVTVHSVFIGLTVGVSDNETLIALLVALSFHQFFEGVALGSRIADAELHSIANEIILTLIFAISAPVGIAIGIGVITALNPNGGSFLLVQGTFDGICAGILIYIGYMLLLKDFPEDMEFHCRGQPNEKYKRAGMFVALWLGAGMMSFIGKYL